MTWDPLHGGEPFHGADPEGISEYGTTLSATGERIGGLVTLMEKLADRDNWESDTADAFREKAEELADQISKAEQRYVDAGTAMTTFGGQLEDHHTDAKALVRMAQEQEQAIVGNPEVTPTPGEDGAPGELTPAERGQNQRRSAAQSQLASLQTAFNRLVDAAQADADAAEDAVNDAREHGADGFWEKHAGWIRTVAGVIAAIAAIVLLTVATGGTIWLVALAVAVAAGVTALVMSIGRYATGNGEWYDIAIDAVSVLTLGAGGVAIRALSRGFPALRGAYATFQGSRAASASLGRGLGVPWAVANWTARARIPLVGLRVPFLTRAGEGGVRSMLHTAGLAEDAARAAATATPAVSPLSRFVLGGSENAGMIRHADEMLRGLRGSTLQRLLGVDDVPISLADDVVHAARLGTVWTVASNVNAVNNLVNIGIAPITVGGGSGVVWLVTDLIGRLR